MSDTVLAMMTEFGAAGLIGLMWMLERRHAAKRDRQLDEAHQRLFSQRQELDVWLGLVRENTRAVSGLEQTQRELIATLQRWRRRRRSEAA